MVDVDVDMDVDVNIGERATVSPCGVIQEGAAALAALAIGDPTRIAACAHAAGCPACADAVAEGILVIAWVDAALAEPACARATDEAAHRAPPTA